MNSDERPVGNGQLFSQTGVINFNNDSRNEDDNDNDLGLGGLIASSNVNNQVGFKSQTLQFNTQLGHDFLNLFAKEDEST